MRWLSQWEHTWTTIVVLLQLLVANRWLLLTFLFHLPQNNFAPRSRLRVCVCVLLPIHQVEFSSSQKRLHKVSIKVVPSSSSSLDFARAAHSHLIYVYDLRDRTNRFMESRELSGMMWSRWKAIWNVCSSGVMAFETCLLLIFCSLFILLLHYRTLLTFCTHNGRLYSTICSTVSSCSSPRKKKTHLFMSASRFQINIVFDFALLLFSSSFFSGSPAWLGRILCVWFFLTIIFLLRCRCLFFNHLEKGMRCARKGEQRAWS